MEHPPERKNNPYEEHKRQNAAEHCKALLYVGTLPKTSLTWLLAETLLKDFPNSHFWTPYLFNEDMLMAKKDKFQWSFVTTQLTEAEKEQFETYKAEQEGFTIIRLVELLERGYKVSARIDLERDIWIVALTGTDQSSHNIETTMTSRHHTLQDCLLLAIFKDVIIASEGEWRDNSSDTQWG